MSLNSEAKQEVERLLLSGKKMQAIKYTSDTFHVSLADAQKLVEVVEIEIKGNRYGHASLDEPTQHEVIRLLEQNKKIEAIKLVKERKDVGLKRSLELVEEIQRGLNPFFVLSNPSGNRIAGKALKTVGLFLGLVGAILVIISGTLYYNQQSLLSKSEQTEGVVVDIVPHEVGGGTYAPIIGYTWKGTAFRYSSTLYSSPPAYEIGETVIVYVNTENPGEVVVNTFSERWLGIVVLSVLGLLFGFFALIAFFSSRKF
ncbi:MAG: DUF3592 domain-containing protein [Cyclobacteriaceae bacterium]|nr:DUF3592 domain-containing protein [Cyclobacteriaceae bacterium]